MSDAVAIKQEPVDDARLLSVTAANLEVCIGDDVKTEECDEPYLKRCKQEPIDFVVDDVEHVGGVGTVNFRFLPFCLFSHVLFVTRSHTRRRRSLVLPSLNDEL